MFWQIVTFTFHHDLGADTRDQFEADLRALADHIPVLDTLTVGRSTTDPSSSGYLTSFSDEAAFEQYLAHPAHQPIGQRAEHLCSRIDRMLMTTNA